MKTLVPTGQAQNPKALSIHQQLLDLREACRTDLRLASSPESSDQGSSKTSRNCDNIAIISCKAAILHVFVNISLLELCTNLSHHYPPNTSLDSEFSMSNADHNSGNDLKLSEDYLNLEIKGLFELAQSNFHKAARTSTLGWRRMVSTYRVICVQARKTREYHPIWDQIHQLVHGPIESDIEGKGGMRNGDPEGFKDAPCTS